MKKLLTGNEAVARGAFEAGVSLATGYPGTPATEIIEALSGLDGVYAEWSANEKTALEMAAGASFAGKRALAVMKHVGLNAAADPLMTLSYTGVGGGLVIAVADDPGMHSSQNEQDSRLYARMAKIPLLEPSDSSEALALTKEAFRISERFDIPVMLRLTASVSHSESPVRIGKRIATPAIPVRKKPEKYVMLPPYCNLRRLDLEKRLKKLGEFSESFRFNKTELSSAKKGVVTSGISYLYVKDAVPDVSVLKLAMTHPLPHKLIREFSKSVKRLFVIEELEPFIEDAIRAEGIKVVGKKEGILPSFGELAVETIRGFMEESSYRPDRKPFGNGAFCPGCPYLGVFYHLKGLGSYVFGDIGCYTLAARLFSGSIDTTLCMGAGVSQAAGFLKANPSESAVAVIGDSTFFHSGIPAVVNALYHKSPLTLIVLDNGVTAMTGGQPHAGSGSSIKGILKALGLKTVVEVGPYDIRKIRTAITGALESGELSAIIVKGECVVKAKPKSMTIEKKLCNRCLKCLGIKCTALMEDEEYPSISGRCIGCSLCASLCPKNAIR